MATTSRPPLGRQLLNLPFRWLGAMGLGADSRYVLTVRGRVTGKRFSTPVDVMTHGGRRYLVAGNSESSWVKNARAVGEVQLRPGGRKERLAVREVEPTTAAPVLRQYVEQVPITRRQFEAKHTDAVNAFVPEVARHPVFEVLDPEDGVSDSEDDAWLSGGRAGDESGGYAPS